MPPEVLKDGNIPHSRKWDVYSFGITIWEILSGQLPYARHTDFMVMNNVINGVRPFESYLEIVRDERGRLPYIKAIMNKCWQEDPGDRPHFEGEQGLFNQIARMEKSSIFESGTVYLNQISLWVGSNDKLGVQLVNCAG